MKTTIVPAQVTTIEDKIAGNVSFSQLLLLTTPVFLSATAYAFLPPFMSLRSYKLSACLFVALVCVMLAIRVKGKIMLSWISIIGQYNLRPRYYLFNKNDFHLRLEHRRFTKLLSEKSIQTETSYDHPLPSDFQIPELIRLEGVLSDPRANFQFKKTKKGDLHVFIQEIK